MQLSSDSIENLPRNTTDLDSLLLPGPMASPCVMSLGNHPEFASDQVSPHVRSPRHHHTMEDELVSPCTIVLVGVPLMALKM